MPQAMPMDTNILEWHYVITGTKGSPYEGGHYHGKLKFPPEVRGAPCLPCAGSRPPPQILLPPQGCFFGVLYFACPVHCCTLIEALHSNMDPPCLCAFF